MDVEVLTITEAITRMTVLAAVLDDCQAPLFSPQHPDILLDPHQTARLVRLLMTTLGSA